MEARELEKQKKMSIIESLKRDMELKSRDVFLQKRLHQERQEVAMEEAISRAQESHGWRASELLQEEKLAYHLDLVKREEIKQMKQRQILWDTKELTELRKQLQKSYFQKALHSQLENIKLEARVKKEEDEVYKRLYEEQSAEYELLMEGKERQSQERKLEYRRQLQDQMIDNHKAKVQEHMKKLEEMDLVNDSVRIITMEDKQEEEERLKKKEAAKKEIEAFREARKVWLLREKKLEETEEMRLENYLRDRFEREKHLQEVNRSKMEAQMRAQQNVVKNIQKMEGVREEKERIAQILLNEDLRLKEELEARKAQELALRRRREMEESVKHQLELKMSRLEEEKRIDAIYRQRLEEDIEQARRMEQEEAERTKQKKLNYGAELRAGMEMMYKKRIEQNVQRAKEFEELLKERQSFQDLIDEEKLRMINEHGPHLVGFLPTRVVEEADLSQLKPELRDHYKSRLN